MDYRKWDALDDSSDDDNEALEAATKLNRRATQMLASDPAEAYALWLEARAKLMEPSGALRAPCMRELAGGVCLNMAACANKRRAWADVTRHADEALSLVKDEPRSGYDRAQAHMWRASARENQGELERALVDLRTASSLDPTNAQLAPLIKRVERKIAAVDYDQRELDASRANEHVERADAALAKSRWDDAVAEATAALPLMRQAAGDEASERKRAAVYERIAISHLRRGDDVGAREALGSARELIREHKGKHADGLVASLAGWQAVLDGEAVEAPPAAPPSA